ncbi:hypothetical protein T4A_1173, partial [Trichinella pseudospiralis]
LWRSSSFNWSFHFRFLNLCIRFHFYHNKNRINHGLES